MIRAIGIAVRVVLFTAFVGFCGVMAWYEITVPPMERLSGRLK